MRGIIREDLPIVVAAGALEVRSGEVGDMTLTFYRVPKGSDFTSLLKGLPGDMCQCPHWGYFLKGKAVLHTKAGDLTLEGGQAFYSAPGHVPEFLEDCELVEFSPTAPFKEAFEHMMRQAASG
jgi:hypothetical protein